MKHTYMKNFIQTRVGFFSLVCLIFWLKTMFAYFTDFSLGVNGLIQYFILLINPLATTIFIFSFALYFKNPKVSYIVLLVLESLNTLLLYANVIYYREFSDFMTINTMLGAKSVSQGLSKNSFTLIYGYDFIYWIDLIILIFLLARKYIKIDKTPIKKIVAVALTVFSIPLFFANLMVAEMNRPELLTRTFDRNYIVKYLGIDVFTVYDGIKTAQNEQIRANADKSDMDDVLKFTKKHYAKPNPEMFGKAKGKNVIYIHLESFQQFLIDKKINDKEVTPFLNKIYHDKSSYSFKNFFHQVGQGKTSDAENMLENSLYGLPQGSVFTQVGSDNTFQAAPAILSQEANYTSAVFHGNGATFWNRNNTYKSLGYNYFFDASYYDVSGDNSLEFGLKDKLLFANSVKYLEQLQQPFYSKFITVSNHMPYYLDENNTDFTKPNTGDKTVDDYFATAHYLDESIEEFFAYLKASGLYENSMIILYGDHYGISNSRNLSLAPELGKDPKEWTPFDDADLQRVPFMVHIPGQQDGKIFDTYAGEIDALPTLLHLLGINSEKYVQFGTDVFSKDHDQTVAFRNAHFVTPKYTVINKHVYNNQTGKELTDLELTPEIQKYVQTQREKVENELALSDSVINSDLLRFYTPTHFKKVDPTNYDYLDQVDKMNAIRKNKGNKSTSIFSKNKDQSTINLYHTDAPEKNDASANGPLPNEEHETSDDSENKE